MSKRLYSSTKPVVKASASQASVISDASVLPPRLNTNSSLPFARTAAAASRKQMATALKFASGKDASLKHRVSATVSDQPIQLPGRASSPGISRAESLLQSTLAQAAFKEALKHGKVRPRTLKLMFVGQGRAGKTSTLKALTGEAFDQNEMSTHGLRSDMPLVRTRDSKPDSLDLQSSILCGWQEVKQPEHAVHELELERSCAQYMAERLRMHRTEGAERDSTDEQNNGMNDDGTGSVEEGQRYSTVTKMPTDLVLQMIDKSGEDQEEPIMLKTWDFGGQREYYVMHHLFLTNRGVYLVITRLDAWLRSDLDCGSTELEDNAFNDDGEFEPPLEALTFWLSSIYVHAPDAIVLIVGTHADKVSHCQEQVFDRVDQEIVRLMEGVPGIEPQIVVNREDNLCFFPVDNSNRSCEKKAGLFSLRSTIDRVASESLAADGAFGAEFPMAWAHLREALESYGTVCDVRKCNGVASSKSTAVYSDSDAAHVLSLVAVSELAGQIGIRDASDLKSCLKFLHNSGSLVFFDEEDLRDFVILDTQWLADAMAHILNCPRVVQGSILATRRLRERGELDDDLLRRHLWKAARFREHHDILLRILYRFDLIIPADAMVPAVNHLVPSLLPALRTDLDNEEKQDFQETVWNSLYFDFHGMLCRLLPTLFPKLIVASSRIPDLSVISLLGLYRNSFRVLWSGQELLFDLLPSSRPQVVRVQLLTSHENCRSGGLSLNTVRALLRLFEATLSNNSHLCFSAGVLCARCRKGGRSQSDRHHVVDVNDIVSEELVVCRASGRVQSVPDGSWAAAWRAEVAGLASKFPSSFNTCSGASHNDVHHPHVKRAFSPAVSTASTTDIALKANALTEDLSSISSCPSVSTRESALAISTGCVGCVYLLYSAPLWQEGKGAIELPALDVHQEVSLLMEATGNAVSLKVELATASNLARLLATASDDQFFILHFSIHCSDNGHYLLFEDATGGAHFFSLEDLSCMLAATGCANRLGLVFLHACSSEHAGECFILAGARNVLCCRGAVFDATARCFTRAFYHSFCVGRKSISQAFNIAKCEIQTASQVGLRGEAEKYVLLSSQHATGSNGHHSQTLYRDLPDMHTHFRPFGTSPFDECYSQLPARVEDFCGRGRSLWSLVQHISSGRRCLVVWGPAGLGKSALLSELARFVGAPGRRLESRIVHVALPDFENTEEVGNGNDPTASFQTAFVACLRILAAAVQRVSLGIVIGEVDDDIPVSADARLLRAQIVQGLSKLEVGGPGALLVIDDAGPWLENEEFRKVLTEVLMRTERAVVVLGSRLATFQTLGSNKVVGYRVEPLQPMDAARLFLWRVHRPLVVSDLSEGVSEASRKLPVIMTPQNRSMVLEKLINHPLLQLCNGSPGMIRDAADRVLPEGKSLWELTEEMNRTFFPDYENSAA